jgi:ADP-heptose:LPS heptosyltransferase
MKVLVRLPNWLGDMVMSVGFMNQLPLFFPGSEISVIAKKGIHELLPFFPETRHRFIFSKDEYKGMGGLLSFGKMIRKTDRFDLFFCLPNSFSSALMGIATGAHRRIGYRHELRSVLLTHAYDRPADLHRAEEYTRLLQLFTKEEAKPVQVSLKSPGPAAGHVVVNINSEASSRRLTTDKAIALIDSLRAEISQPIVLVGALKEAPFVESVINGLANKEGVSSAAGKTSLTALVQLLGTAKAMLTTDSGPAHLANALGTPTVVLFGAGRESHTAPYDPLARKVIRLGELSCEPCEKNVCVRFGIPQCLERLSIPMIVSTTKQILDNGQ